MTDFELIERLRIWNDDEAADRIEELVKQRDLSRSHVDAVLKMLSDERAEFITIKNALKVIYDSPLLNQSLQKFMERFLSKLMVQ